MSPDPDSGSRPESRGPQEALGGLISYDGVITHKSIIIAGSAFDAIIHKPFFVNVIIFIHFYR